MVFVPIAHHLIHAATVHTCRQAAHVIDEMTEEHRIGREFHVVDIAVQGLVQREYELRHTRSSPWVPGTTSVRLEDNTRNADRLLHDGSRPGKPPSEDDHRA